MRVCNDRLYELVGTYVVEDAFWHSLVERLSALQRPKQGPFLSCRNPFPTCVQIDWLTVTNQSTNAEQHSNLWLKSGRASCASFVARRMDASDIEENLLSVHSNIADRVDLGW